MSWLNCEYGIVSPIDTWYCQITKKICPGQAWVSEQPQIRCKHGVILNPLIYETLSRLTGKEYKYPWETSATEKYAMVKFLWGKLSLEEFKKWYGIRDI
jgi:hypothetical protein